VSEEVGHWLPQSSGLLTPMGSDEPFQAKISFSVICIMKSQETTDNLSHPLTVFNQPMVLAHRKQLR